MGSDVCEGGIKGMGASKRNEILNNLPNKDEESINKDLIKLLMKKLNTDRNVVQAYCEAIMHEPVDHVNSGSIKRRKHVHLENEPTQVHEHVGSFIHPNNKECKIIKNKVSLFACEVHDET